MKKIFTLAAAVLASLSLWAADPTLEINTESQGTEDFVKAYEAEGITLSSTASFSSGAVQLGNTPSSYDQHYFEVLSATNAIDSISFLISGNGSNKSIQAPLFGWEETATGNTADTYVLLDAVTVSANSYAAAQWFTYDLSSAGVKCARIYRSTKGISSVSPAYTGSSTALGSGQTIKIYGIKVWLNGQAPVVSTDPVASVTVAGPTEAFVGQKASFSATTDVKANAYKWFVNDAEQEGATSAKFDFTPDAEGNYSIVCQAKNDNNADFVASEAIVLVATVKPVLAPVSISEATVWDFSKAASVREIKWEGDAKDADPIVMANIDGFNNNDNFNSQALLFSGEYPIRDGKYCQGPLLKFNTTVAGYLTIEYSNTGNRSAAEGETEGQEALRRFLAINGALVDGDEGSMKSNNNTITNNIPVAAGDVEISARMPYRTDEKDVNAPEYIRIYKVQFTLEEIPTGINNAEEAVKTVKVIRNGQLFIEKNGVLFNAQGARL